MESKKSRTIKELRRIATVCVLATVLSGCATVGYLQDRGYDAADMVTATWGMGLGAKTRVGPINVGAFENFDCGGLRGGVFEPVSSIDFNPYDLTLTVYSGEAFSPSTLDIADKRNKFFASRGYAGLTLAYPPDEMFYGPVPKERILRRELIPYYTQVEVALGLRGTVRLGVNPGELLDFVVGWTTLDMFNDDVFLESAAGELHTETSLHEAARDGSLGVVEHLIEKGTAINLRDEHGKTALHHAAEHGHNGTTSFLVESGADCNAKDNEGRTALDYATRNGHQATAAVLEPHTEGGTGPEETEQQTK